jgi:hypothetical protein
MGGKDEKREENGGKYEKGEDKRGKYEDEKQGIINRKYEVKGLTKCKMGKNKDTKCASEMIVHIDRYCRSGKSIGGLGGGVALFSDRPLQDE